MPREGLTEQYRCPLTGDDPGTVWPVELRHPRTPPGPNDILIPGRILPGPLTDEQAEHERALYRAEGWKRMPDGRVYLWVVM